MKMKKRFLGILLNFFKEEKLMKMKKRFLGILLSLVMVLGLVPGMSLTAYADNQKAYAAYDVTTNDNKTKSVDALTALQVKFNGKSWYIIADDSTAVNAGTVTLLAAESFGNSKFDDSSNKYSTSTIKTTLYNMTASGGDFADVASAINTVKVKGSESDGEVDAKLYLLNTTEASNVPENVRKFSTSWWLRSPGDSDMKAAFVDGGSGVVYAFGYGFYYVYGVRPALKLNLSSVIFDSESKEFSLKPPHTHNSITFEAWTNAQSLPTKAGSYYLTTDVTLSGSSWQVPIGTTNLCLNGHGIIQKSSARVIEIKTGATLNLHDCGTTVHRYTVSNGLATVNDNATGEGVKTFTGGYITGANVTTVSGGGVYINYGTLHMSGGTIIGNHARSGGGVFVDYGTFDMTGGVITGNTCSAWGGGAIVYHLAAFNVSGTPVIDGNYKGSEVSNVHLNEYANRAGIITIAGPGLKPGAKIGVYQYTPGKYKITSGYKTYHEGDNPLTYFSSDQGRAIIVRPDGELQTTATTGIAASISYDITEVQKNPGDGPFINPLNNTGNGTVTYAVTPGTGVAEVDSSTGEVRITGTGEATITATVADTTAYTYDPKTASYTLSVHNHSFTYTANGDTITATCTAEGCSLPPSTDGGSDHVATLTISASGGTYDGTTAYGATITDANSIQGDAKVQYQKKSGGSYGTATTTAPTKATRREPGHGRMQRPPVSAAWGLTPLKRTLHRLRPTIRL